MDIKKSYTWIREPKDDRDYKAHEHFKLTAQPLPSSVDLRSRMSAVNDVITINIS